MTIRITRLAGVSIVAALLAVSGIRMWRNAAPSAARNAPSFLVVGSAPSVLQSLECSPLELPVTRWQRVQVLAAHRIIGSPRHCISPEGTILSGESVLTVELTRLGDVELVERQFRAVADAGEAARIKDSVLTGLLRRPDAIQGLCTVPDGSFTAVAFPAWDAVITVAPSRRREADGEWADFYTIRVTASPRGHWDCPERRRLKQRTLQT